MQYIELIMGVVDQIRTRTAIETEGVEIVEEIAVGTKVRVAIPESRKAAWARAHRKALDGKIGIVSEKGAAHLVSGSVPKSLVAFDDPPLDPSPMAPGGCKLTQFWLLDTELQKR